MAGQRFTKRNRGSVSGKLRRRRRVVGLSAATGTFLAAATTPLAPAPTANAEPITNTVSGLVHFGPIVDPAPGEGGTVCCAALRQPSARHRAAGAAQLWPEGT
jgi:hypothetical protein